jgi:uncharacterized cupredoxin-like copper-binding protein
VTRTGSIGGKKRGKIMAGTGRVGNSGFGIAALRVAAIVVALAPGAAWAGGTHKEGAGHWFGEPGGAAEVTRTIYVDAVDMDYRMSSVHLADGETIRFFVSNADDVPHDFTIGPASAQAEHRAEMMAMMADDGTMAQMHTTANAVYVAPGETKSFIWKFDETAGLEFACNIPGHYEAGMKGHFETGG